MYVKRTLASVSYQEALDFKFTVTLFYTFKHLGFAYFLRGCFLYTFDNGMLLVYK